MTLPTKHRDNLPATLVERLSTVGVLRLNDSVMHTGIVIAVEDDENFDLGLDLRLANSIGIYLIPYKIRWSALKMPLDIYQQ